MILVDTSVWIDHLRRGEAALIRLLEAGQVMTHPFVIGELALGSLSQRAVILDALQSLPRVNVAIDGEVLSLIDSRPLSGVGIGYVDAHLLAAATLTPQALLWTRDKYLFKAAQRLGLAREPTG